MAASYRGSTAEFVSVLDTAIARAQELGAGRDSDSGTALLTYFKAKGRQWHTVILASCNEGLIPHGRAPIEDERRLFYVALTRCSANLVISYLRKFSNSKTEPSRFLAEAGLLLRD